MESFSPDINVQAPEPKGPMAWMAGNSVAANLIMLFCLVGGFLALRNMKHEVFPDIQIDAVNIQVSYPGASPEEVERGVILAVEEAVSGLEGVNDVTSVANEGSGTVTVDLLTDADPQKVAQDIQSEVDRITTFPEDAEAPSVSVVQHRREVLSAVIHGDVPVSILHEIGEQIRDQFRQDPNITLVELEGVPPLEISIEISEENLRRYGLTLDDVATRLKNSALDVPGGGIKTEKGEILVRVTERRDYGKEFARLPIITTEDGAEVLLGRIAEIKDGYADTDRYSLYNGHPAVELLVYRVGSQTPVQVSKAVRSQLEDIVGDLPPGISVSIENDRSEHYNDRVNLLLKNGGMGLVLVLIVLGIFLEARLAFWVMMGIPVSFMGSFLILPSAGITINMVSLFAYIIALGIVVDDAIVVGENVYHYRQEGLPFLKAAVKGAREVAMPVTFSILTNIAAFLPIYFIPGTIGNIFKMIPVVVCIVFMISLVESLFVLPAHLAHSNGRNRKGISSWIHGKQQGFSRWFRGLVERRYGPFLDFTLRHRYLTASVAISILTGFSAYALSGRMGFQLFPQVESDQAEASLTLPFGSPVEMTERIMKRFNDKARKVAADSGHPELIESIVTDIGRGGSHAGRMRVMLADPEIRDKIMSTTEFTNRWRSEVGDIAGVEFMKFAADSGGPGSHSRALTVQLSHRNIDTLEKASHDLARAISTYPIVKDVDDGFQPGKPQLDFTIKPEGKSLGFTPSEVARQVRSAFYGAEVLRQQRGRNEIKVMVRLLESERSSERVVEEMMLRSPTGAFVPLREVASTKRGRAYTSIERRNGRRVVEVSADVDPRSKAGEVLNDMKKTILTDLTAKYPGLIYSFEGHEADIRDSMNSLKLTFTLAMLAIFAMLAIPFRSYSQALIVMASIPFGIIGAFLGHLIMGYNLCIPSMFGIVALSGVVVNDSLVMIDFANHRLRDLGMTHHDAVHDAAIQRFRPILLTTLTTFGGLAPMIFERSRQARFLIPMALSLGFGIVFATLITLVIVPSFYLVLEDVKNTFSAVKRFIYGNRTGIGKAESGGTGTE